MAEHGHVAVGDDAHMAEPDVAERRVLASLGASSRNGAGVGIPHGSRRNCQRRQLQFSRTYHWHACGNVYDHRDGYVGFTGAHRYRDADRTVGATRRALSGNSADTPRRIFYCDQGPQHTQAWLCSAFRCRSGAFHFEFSLEARLTLPEQALKRKHHWNTGVGRCLRHSLQSNSWCQIRQHCTYWPSRIRQRESGFVSFSASGSRVPGIS